jgi:hypothetical protein
LFVLFGLIGQIKEPESFQPPDEHIQPFQKMKPIGQDTKNRFSIHPAPAQQKIPYLLTGTANEGEIAPLPNDRDELAKIDQPVYHGRWSWDISRTRLKKKDRFIYKILKILADSKL